MQCFKRCLLALVATTAVLAAVCAGLALHVAGWLADADPPQRAAAILVLGGDPSRARQAADLYRAGYAPKVYVSVPVRYPALRRMDDIGVVAPREEELTRRVLLATGVPGSAIEPLGHEVLSTAQEAKLVGERLAGVPGTLIVVTSPYHLRRARMIFRDTLRGSPAVVFVGNRYEPFPDEWWRDQGTALAVILELTKTIFYVIGGRF